MASNDQELVQALHETNVELTAAQEIVRELANNLADVADVIEPVLTQHTQRIRQVRMTTVEELRQITTAVKEMRAVVLNAETTRMIEQAERFLKVCRELKELEVTGFLKLLRQTQQE